MTMSRKFVRRPVVHLMAASIFAGFVFQTEWAVSHDFEHYSFRVFLSALLLFVILEVLRVILKRASGGVSDDFDAKYGEFVLLLALFPVFQIIDNTFIQTAVILLYVVIMIGYAATGLDIAWCKRLRNWFTGSALSELRNILSRRLSYSIRDDIEPGVLHVRLRMSNDTPPSTSLIKSRVAALYQDLPDAGEFREMKVDVHEVDAEDEVLARLLEPLSYYASLAAIDRVSVAGGEQRLDRLAAMLPEGRYAFERPADSGAGA